MKNISSKVFNRIHINSINMSQAGMLSSGGVGFSIEYAPITVEVALTSKEKNSCSGFQIQRLEDFLKYLYPKYRLPLKGWNINVFNKLRPHIGLGSRTQIESQILTSLLKLGCDKTPEYYEFIENRIGIESGIGLKCFLRNGFHIDFGYWRKNNMTGCLNSTDAVLKSMFFKIPEDWSVLLMIPSHYTSISGTAERDFWNKIIPIKESEAHKISFNILMGIIPSILDNRFFQFIESLNLITELGTKLEENKLNERYIKSLYKDIKATFGFCGLSSLGPSCYTFYINNKSSHKMIEEISTVHKDYKFIPTRIIYE